jgi:hypothetical protein
MYFIKNPGILRLSIKCPTTRILILLSHLNRSVFLCLRKSSTGVMIMRTVGRNLKLWQKFVIRVGLKFYLIHINYKLIAPFISIFYSVNSAV